MIDKVDNRYILIRDEATKCFSSGDFDAGDLVLAENSEPIPDYIKAECLGNRFFYQKDFENAIRCYEEGIKLNSGHLVSRYQYLVGVQLEKQGSLVDAFKRYQSAIEAEPDFVDAYVELGGLLVKVEDFSGALRCYQDAFKIDNKDSKNILNLKSVLERLVSDGSDEYLVELEHIRNLSEGISPPEDYQW